MNHDGMNRFTPSKLKKKSIINNFLANFDQFFHSGFWRILTNFFTWVEQVRSPAAVATASARGHAQRQTAVGGGHGGCRVNLFSLREKMCPNSRKNLLIIDLFSVLTG